MYYKPSLLHGVVCETQPETFVFMRLHISAAAFEEFNLIAVIYPAADPVSKGKLAAAPQLPFVVNNHLYFLSILNRISS